MNRLSGALLALLLAAPVWAADPGAPAAASAPDAHGALAMPHKKKLPPPPPAKLVDINAASRKELMTLPGVSAADAERIIAGRPYLTKTDLVNKKVLPTGPYLALRRYVVAMRHGPLPKPAKPLKPAASAPPAAKTKA
jgi:competence protein ComEA